MVVLPESLTTAVNVIDEPVADDRVDVGLSRIETAPALATGAVLEDVAGELLSPPLPLPLPPQATVINALITIARNLI
jgi:hypothetical protein